MKSRWLIPVVLAVVLAWLTTRSGRGGFMRLPTPSFPMPAWTMSDLDGHPVASTNFAGKVLVLNFWATWCPPCIAEIPDLKAFHAARQAEGVVVVGASIDAGGAADVKPFVIRNQIDYPVLLAEPPIQELFGGVASIPATFIVSREGRIVARYLGALTQEELNKVVTPLLKPSP